MTKFKFFIWKKISDYWSVEYKVYNITTDINLSYKWVERDWWQHRFWTSEVGGIPCQTMVSLTPLFTINESVGIQGPFLTRTLH